ncbi:hypothetical protein NL676_037105 [Syzygium grande]|nr:hypothetical protein NL676_037105 [Syzygium grande]
MFSRMDQEGFASIPMTPPRASPPFVGTRGPARVRRRRGVGKGGGEVGSFSFHQLCCGWGGERRLRVMGARDTCGTRRRIRFDASRNI